MDHDFWDNFLNDAALGKREASGMDEFLRDHSFEGDHFTSVRQLTETGRAKDALPLPVAAGTRVEFKGRLGAVMAYADPPDPGSQGTVVLVRSATGDITDHDGKVFVAWDDGKTRAIHAEHLREAQGRRKRQATHSIRVASLGDITDFLKVADDTLIHTSTKDLWSFRQDNTNGEYVIERLFDSNGEPLKG